MALRMFADALILQIALGAALTVRWGLLFFLQDVTDSTELRSKAYIYLSDWGVIAGPLSVVSLLVFYVAGFYTYGRFYQGRYKALVVTQAVTFAYLLYGFLAYFFSGDIFLPRGALILAWVFSVALLVGARVWSTLWDRFVHAERAELQLHSSVAQRVLVIGGAGFIGSALVPKLLQRGLRVQVLDSLMFGQESLADVAGHPNLKVIEGDFRHVENLVEAMRGVDTVVHLGAIVGDPACELDQDLTIDINLSATRVIAELAKSAGVRRFFYASTCSVYGACDDILDERSEAKPVSLYGRTKLASEQILLSMATPTFAPTILRFATIYGLSGRMRFDLVVNLMTAEAKIDGHFSVYGGDQWRPFVHVDDVAFAVDTVLSAPVTRVGAQVYNVGSNEQNYTIDQVGQRVHQHVVAAELKYIQNSGDSRNYRVDFSKIRNQLGFQPRLSMDDGIQQVLEAIASGQVVDFREPKHSNAVFLTQEGTLGLARDNWAREMIQSMVGE